MNLFLIAAIAVAANGSAGPQAPASAGASAGAKKVCISDAFTGTRIARKVCKTPAEWAAEGVSLRR